MGFGMDRMSAASRIIPSIYSNLPQGVRTMASRAATLAKPKAKPKTTSKTPATKSKAIAAKAISVKPRTTTAAKNPVAKTATPKSNPGKASSTFHKAETIKAPTLKTVVAKSIKPKAAASEGGVAVGTASFETSAPKPRRRKGEIRTRIYWAVFNQALRRVAVFEFDQKVEAEKRAAKLAKASGEHHFIQKIKAIVQ